MLKRSFRRGFTITELSLSIAFIAILSLAVILIVTDTISSYHRGLTLNRINTAGMDLVDDMRAAVQNSPARSVEKECASVYGSSGLNEDGTPIFNSLDVQKQCEDDHGHNFVTVVRYADVYPTGSTQSIGNVPVFGAFCTGMYSYVWNSGYYFTEDFRVGNGSSSGDSTHNPRPATVKYKLATSDTPISSSVPTETAEGFKLLKIRDEERAICISSVINDPDKPLSGRYIIDNTNERSINSGSHEFNITNYNVIEEEPIDILAGDASKNLAIYNLTSAVPSESSTHNSLFYSISFILGTIQGGINISASGNFCATPSGYNSTVENFDYCAINKFNFAAQAMGG